MLDDRLCPCRAYRIQPRLWAIALRYSAPDTAATAIGRRGTGTSAEGHEPGKHFCVHESWDFRQRYCTPVRW